jgi:hypothetical protein
MPFSESPPCENHARHHHDELDVLYHDILLLNAVNLKNPAYHDLGYEL